MLVDEDVWLGLLRVGGSVHRVDQSAFLWGGDVFGVVDHSSLDNS